MRWWRGSSPRLGCRLSLCDRLRAFSCGLSLGHRLGSRRIRRILVIVDRDHRLLNLDDVIVNLGDSKDDAVVDRIHLEHVHREQLALLDRLLRLGDVGHADLRDRYEPFQVVR